MRATVGNRRVRTWRKLTGIIAASMLAMSAVGGGTAFASTPDWTVGHGTDSFASPQPSSGASSTAVSAGNTVGFFEWLRNDGTSNISQLYLTARTTPSAQVFGATWTIRTSSGAVVRSGVCPSTTPLNCSFGALNPTQTVYATVAFTTGNAADGTTQSVVFDWNANGNTPSDKGHTSRGDSILLNDSVILTNNGDAAGNFNFDQAAITVADNQNVSNKNPQATSVTVSGTQTGVAVGDSPSLTTPCNSTLTAGFPSWFSCSQLTSLTSSIEVGNGKTFNNTNGGPGIKVIVTFNKAPNQLNGALPFVYHYFVDAAGVGQADLITATCNYVNGFPAGDTPAEGCLTVNGKVVTVWVFYNGSMKS